jgi:hypothetical protein
MEDSKSVAVGSLVGQNEPPVPIDCHTQPSEPMGDKNRITTMALKSADCAGLGKDRGGGIRVCGAANREVWERRRMPGYRACGGG